jgi:hypothetical protein
MPIARRARIARPPITPPTMAPMGVEWCVGVDAGEVGVGVVGVVEVVGVVDGFETAAEFEIRMFLERSRRLVYSPFTGDTKK